MSQYCQYCGQYSSYPSKVTPQIPRTSSHSFRKSILGGDPTFSNSCLAFIKRVSIALWSVCCSRDKVTNSHPAVWLGQRRNSDCPSVFCSFDCLLLWQLWLSWLNRYEWAPSTPPLLSNLFFSGRNRVFPAWKEQVFGKKKKVLFLSARLPHRSRR